MPVALAKSDEIWNQLVSLEFGDVEAAMAAYFRTMGIARSASPDAALSACLARACQLVGKHDEGVEHVLAANARWNTAKPQVRWGIACLLADFGLKEQALSCARRFLIEREIPWENLIRIAVQYGDLDLVAQVIKKSVREKDKHHAVSYLENISEMGLTEIFSDLQSATMEIVGPYLISAEDVGIFIQPDEGTLAFSMRLLIDGAKINRFDLSDRLQDRLDAFTISHFSGDASWQWKYAVQIAAAPRHPSIPAAARSRIAA